MCLDEIYESLKGGEKVKTLNFLSAIFWLGMFVSLFFGHKPNVLVIGCAFMVCVLNSLRLDMEYKKGG